MYLLHWSLRSTPQTCEPARKPSNIAKATAKLRCPKGGTRNTSALDPTDSQLTRGQIQRAATMNRMKPPTTSSFIGA